MIEIADDNAEGVDEVFPIPRLEVLPAYPANHNVMEDNMHHMRTLLPRGWVAIHGGDAPEPATLRELILVNSKTGQRFKIVFDGS